MDYLSTLMSTPEKDSTDSYVRGPPRQLKTFIIESNSKITEDFQLDGVKGSVVQTGVPDIKLVQLYGDNIHAQLFLDVADERFWVLHTNVWADKARGIVSKFVGSENHAFDRTWFPTSMLKEISGLPGNRSFGYGIRYRDQFLPDYESDVPVKQLKLTISGTESNEAIEAMRTRESLRNSLAYYRVRIRRGAKPNYAEDDLSYSGSFVVKDGSSIDDHISLVNDARKHYRKKMEEIENFRIGVKTVEDRTLIEGKAFDFEFKRRIDNWETFLKRILSSSFRLWGLKSKLNEDYYRILAVDLHTGDPFDLEISQDFMRVYLPKGSCGNVVLRLLVNLQQSFDSNLQCEELGITGAAY
jgi:hypothetical protein